MATIRELLRGLSNEELDALEQEFTKAQNNNGEIISQQGRGLLRANMPSRIGRAALEGIRAGGESIVSDVREMAGFKPVIDPAEEDARALNLFARQKAIEASLSGKEWKPQTQEEAIAFEKEKAEAKSNKYTPDEISSIVKQLSDMGNDMPPGTTVKLGEFTIPLNPKLTQEQGASVAAASEVQDDVVNLKALLAENEGSLGIIAKTKLPYWMVGGSTEEIKRLRDLLSLRIPFAKGGKQLTPFEAKTLFALLPQPGQELITINRNLDKFVSEFNKLSEIAIKGTAGTKNVQDNLQNNLQNKEEVTPEEALAELKRRGKI